MTPEMVKEAADTVSSALDGEFFRGLRGDWEEVVEPTLVAVMTDHQDPAVRMLAGLFRTIANQLPADHPLFIGNLD